MKTLQVQVAVAPGPSTIVYHSMRRPLPVQELILACAVQHICRRLGEITVGDVFAAVRTEKTLLGLWTIASEGGGKSVTKLALYCPFCWVSMLRSGMFSRENNKTEYKPNEEFGESYRWVGSLIC